MFLFLFLIFNFNFNFYFYSYLLFLFWSLFLSSSLLIPSFLLLSGAKFWEKNFIKQETIQWSKFIPLFYQWIGREIPPNPTSFSFSATPKSFSSIPLLRNGTSLLNAGLFFVFCFCFCFLFLFFVFVFCFCFLFLFFVF